MKQIEITSIKRFEDNGYAQLSYRMLFSLPVVLIKGQVPIAGIEAILSSYPEGYSVEGESLMIVFTGNLSITKDSNIDKIKDTLINQYTEKREKLDALTIQPYDTIAGLSWDGKTWE